MTQIISVLSDENQSLNLCIIMKNDKLKEVYFIKRNYLFKKLLYWKECVEIGVFVNASKSINQKLFREQFGNNY